MGMLSGGERGDGRESAAGLVGRADRGLGLGLGLGLRAALRALAAATCWVALTAAEASARAGGGSSHFGGFGRGGGSGRGFGGHGHFVFIPVGGGGGVFLFILVLLVVFFVLPRLVRWWRSQQNAGPASRRRVAQRERRVELAAAEAAEEDAAFAPEQVRAQARSLFLEIQSAWSAGRA